MITLRSKQCFVLLGLMLAGLMPNWALAGTIFSAGPLYEIETTPDLNCRVEHTTDTSSQFFGGTACGTFLVVNETLFGPGSIPAGSSASPRTPWTPVSQSPVSGAGTEADPYKMTTVVMAGSTGVTVTQVDSYVVGSESYRTDVTIDNSNGEAVSGILYRAADCFLGGNDQGFGRVDPVAAGNAIACVGATGDVGDEVLGDRIQQWEPLTAGSSYIHGKYWEVWLNIGSQSSFNNTCRCSELVDNGAGLSWNVTLDEGTPTVTHSHRTTFSPDGSSGVGGARTETRLELNPMLVKGTRTYLKFIARLFDGAGEKLGAGHEIRFYAWDGTFLCSGETDAQGKAFCNPALQSQVLSYGRLRYRAQYMGSEEYKPSTDAASAVETLGTGVR